MSEEKKPKVSADMAQAELRRWMDAMDLELSDNALGANEVKAKERVIKALTDGHMIIDENGRPVVTTSSGLKVVFNEPTGAAFMAMDGKGADHEVTKQFAFMAAVTELDVVTFSKMKNRDLNVCLGVVALFLA